MSRKLSLAVLLSVRALPGSARAGVTYTPAKLAGMLSTQEQLSQPLIAQGSAHKIAATTDLPSRRPHRSRPDLHRRGKFRPHPELLSLPDGSAHTASCAIPCSAVVHQELGAGVLHLGQGACRNGLTLGRICWAAYLGTSGGVEYNVMDCSFIRGNLFGLVLYATTGVNDGTVVAAAFEAQLDRLP